MDARNVIHEFSIFFTWCKLNALIIENSSLGIWRNLCILTKWWTGYDSLYIISHNRWV